MEELETGVYSKRLSTITERTERSERTEQSQPWPTHQELLAAHAPRRPPSTPTTSSYGQVIHPSASKFGLASRSGGADREDERSVETTSDFGEVIGMYTGTLYPILETYVTANCISIQIGIGLSIQTIYIHLRLYQPFVTYKLERPVLHLVATLPPLHSPSFP